MEHSRGRGVTSGGCADQWAVDPAFHGRELSGAVTSSQVGPAEDSGCAGLWVVKSVLCSRSAGVCVCVSVAGGGTWGNLGGSLGTPLGMTEQEKGLGPGLRGAWQAPGRLSRDITSLDPWRGL